MRDPSQVAAAIDFCENKCGLPDIIINNAAGNFVSPTERLAQLMDFFISQCDGHVSLGTQVR